MLPQKMDISNNSCNVAYLKMKCKLPSNKVIKQLVIKNHLLFTVPNLGVVEYFDECVCLYACLCVLSVCGHISETTCFIFT